MLVDPQSHGLILNPEIESQRLPNYSTTSLQGQQYRILTRQFKSHQTMINIWTVFWLFTTLTLACFIFMENQQTKPILALSFLAMQALCQAAFVWVQKKYLNSLFLVVTISWLIYSTVVLAAVIFQVNLTIVPTILLSLFLILMSSMKVKHKGRVVLVSILLVQLTLASAKIDNLIQMSWQQVVLPILPVSLISLSALIFISIYSLLLKRYYQETFRIKKQSLMFLAINFLGITAILGFIISEVYFKIPIQLTATLATSSISMVTLYLFIYNKQIAVAFCRHKQIVDKNSKQNQFELFPQKKQFYPELFRYSQNWFGKQEIIHQEHSFPEDLPECIICTDSKCQIVWLPCGHLITCSSCCQDMLQNLMLNCVLCKQRPTQICILETKDLHERLLEQEMGISQQKKNKKYSVSGLFQIKSVE